MKKLDSKEPGFEKELAQILKERSRTTAKVEQTIKKIFAETEKNREKALIGFAKKFDGFKGSVRDLKVSQKEIDAAEKKLSTAQIAAIRLAKKRIEKFHRLQKPKGYRIKEADGFLEERWIPLSRVGIYVPAGKAPLASTVLMTAIPARLAGVKEIAIATPAGPDNKIHPAILFAAKLNGVKEIYRVGGAQAIAAFALGAGPVKKVDKIFGPGGAFVAAAKVYAQSQGLCGIDTLAGPSEILILSDGSVPAEFAAADLSAQLEHGSTSWAFLVSASKKYIDQVLAQKIHRGKNLVFILARNIKEMIALSNRIAPEHLEVHLRNPESVINKLTSAPAIFIGPFSPVALGDYIAGTNHSLPTAGRGVFDSPLGVWDFMKRQSLCKISKDLVKKLASPASTFALLEGLSEHSKSLEIRADKLKRR